MQAREEATRPDATPVGLMSGEQLVLLLIENGIGVSRRSHDLFELEDLSSAEAGTDANAPSNHLNDKGQEQQE